MCSYAAHMSNTKIIEPPTNVARLCTHCFLFIATIFFLILIFNSEKFGMSLVEYLVVASFYVN